MVKMKVVNKCIHSQLHANINIYTNFTFNLGVRTFLSKESILKYNKYTKYNSRNYSTISNKNDENSPKIFDKEILKILNSYPKSLNASPYDILNISLNKRKDIKNNDLKKKFFSLAKIYHPDSISYLGYPINNDNSFYTKNSILLLDDKIKNERFKKILSAYNLLKNPITKSNYDNYNIGWNDSTNLRTNPNMYNPSSNDYKNYNSNNFKKSNFTSYETGTWEDKYKYGHETAYGFYNDKSWSSSKNGDLKEEFLKNKKTIILSFLLTLFIYSTLELTHLFLYDDLIGDKHNLSLDASNVDIHKKSEDDLFHAYTNYGLGDTKQDRINRFLWWRKFTMSFSLADVTEVLDNFYKRGVIENNEIDESTKLKHYDYKTK